MVDGQIGSMQPDELRFLLSPDGRAWQGFTVTLIDGDGALLNTFTYLDDPDRLSLTYWYAADPDQPRVVTYDAATHRRNWAEMERIVAEIDRLIAAGTAEAWPLTDELSECRRCAYQALTGRQFVGEAEPETLEEDASPDDDWLEPQWG